MRLLPGVELLDSHLRAIEARLILRIRVVEAWIVANPVMIAEVFLMADRPNHSGWLGVRPTSLISAFSDNTRRKRSGLSLLWSREPITTLAILLLA
jgi:hypothetical protein